MRCCASSTRSAGFIFLRDTNIRSDTRAGISPRSRRRSKSPRAGREIVFQPLNRRGEILNRIIEPLLAAHPHWEQFSAENDVSARPLKPLPELFPEEERSKQPSAFSILRVLDGRIPPSARVATRAGGRVRLRPAVPVRSDRAQAPAHRRQGSAPVSVRRHLFHGSQEGADRALPLRFRTRRRDHARPSRPPRRKSAKKKAAAAGPIASDHTPEEYMAKVETVREGMRRGDYYEVVLRQTFRAPYSGSPSELFERIQHASPSPYEFFLQFGDEQLIGASPEMFVRVEGRRVETCPIAGTARRTGDPLRDADSIRELLNSTKEESELTMCSDVDRNDKSRVCEPGSVRVHRPAPDRILRGRVSHRGSRRRNAGRGLRFARRIPDAHVGRDHHRRAQEMGGAGHRESGKGRARRGTEARWG